MIHVFFKRSKNKNPAQDQPEIPGAGRRSRLTNWLVVKLQDLEQLFSNRQKKILLLVFTVLAGASCLYLLAGGFKYHGSNDWLRLDSIQPVSNAYQQDNFMQDYSPHQWILDFQHYLDSMKADPQGRAFYDSLQRARPGLIDSVAKAAQFLQNNK
jgi:hypothetical protein